MKSGFVALLGRPNVGKSTLLNQLIGQKVAITSPVMQTTRHRIRGVVNDPKGQIVFLDTPGFSKPIDDLGTYLVDEGFAALKEADLFVLVFDCTVPPGKGDAWLVEQVKQQLSKAPPSVENESTESPKPSESSAKPLVLVLNKADRIRGNQNLSMERMKAYGQLVGELPYQIILLSAKTGKKVGSLIECILTYLPEGPAYYDEDAVTDQRMREIAAEMIREKVLHFTQDELPHSVAVGIDRFEEAEEITRIYATLFVNQTSQKGMVIGEGGQMIKKIGMAARKDIEELVEKKVFLDLTVKVKANWRKDAKFLKSLGLAPPSQQPASCWIPPAI